MPSLPDSITAWASAIAAVFGVVGLVQSRSRFVALGALLLAASLAAGFYARRQQARLRSALITLEECAETQRHAGGQL